MVSTKTVLAAATLLAGSATANPLWGFGEKSQLLSGTGSGELAVIHCTFFDKKAFFGTSSETHFEWTSPTGTVSYTGSTRYVAADKRRYRSMSAEHNGKKFTVDQASNKKTIITYNHKKIQTGAPDPYIKDLEAVKKYCMRHTKQDINTLTNLRVGFLSEVHVYQKLPDILA